MTEKIRNISIMIPENARTVISYLEAAGYEAWVVGGCVRDCMVGKTPHDWDITTSATPEQMKKVVPYPAIDTGIEHGTVTFIVNGEPIETTVYRTEGKYSDGRHPDYVELASTIEEDLSRRDFTMNAMAFSETHGLKDPFGGAKDLENKTLRCVRKATERFDEDGLRIMRALRFAAVYDLAIENSTADAMHEKRDKLSCISIERIQSELVKMLSAKNGLRLANLFDEFSDIIFTCIPELKIAYGYDQSNKNHDRDLWHHMLDTMAAVKADPNIRMAALIHDIGKPETRSENEDGSAHYQNAP